MKEKRPFAGPAAVLGLFLSGPGIFTRGANLLGKPASPQDLPPSFLEDQAWAKDQERDGPDNAAILERVRWLGDESVERRDRGEFHLVEYGVTHPGRVLRLLPRTSPDPEVQMRLERIRGKIPFRHACYWALLELNRGTPSALTPTAEVLYREPSIERIRHVVHRTPIPEPGTISCGVIAVRSEADAVVAALPMLKHPDPALRAGTVKFMRERISYPAWRTIAGPHVAPLLADPDPEVRLEAAMTLAESRDPAHVPALFRRLRATPEGDEARRLRGTIFRLLDGSFADDLDLPATCQKKPSTDERDRAIRAWIEREGIAARFSDGDR